MKLSPLQLEHRYFTKILVEASIEADPTNKIKLDTHAHCQQHEENPRKWMVTLDVSLKPEDTDKPLPYVVEIQIIGFFVVLDGYPETEMNALVMANGPAVLFGSVREIVSSLTARGPYVRIDLPTVTFVDAVEKTRSSSKVTRGTRGKKKTSRRKKKS